MTGQLPRDVLAETRHREPVAAAARATAARQVPHAPERPSRATHWSRVRETGTVAGLRFLYAVYRLLGRRVFGALLWPVAAWFALTRADLRAASRDWLDTHAAHFPERWPDGAPGVRDTLRHFHAFGQTILDKALAWTAMPVEQDFTLEDPDTVRQTLSDPGGQLVIGSHLGNLEYCRGFMGQTHRRTVNVLVHDRHSVRFVEAMSRLSPDSRLNVFQVDELDVGRVLELKGRIERGEWLFIAGDRVPVSGDARTATVDFMGRPASLPVGPYLLARTLACPVKLMFAWRDADTVRVDLQRFAGSIELPRGDREAALATCAQRFADALAAQAARTPYQWFNFFSFWQHGR